MRSLRVLSLAVSAVLILTPAVYAATISAGIQDPVANGGQAPGSAANYDFFDFGDFAGPINLTSFTVSTAGVGQYPGVGQPIPYTTVIAPGGSTAFTTGI